MQRIAAAGTPQEVAEAARYLAARPYAPHTRVVETAVAPRAVAISGVYRFEPGPPSA